MAAEEAGTLVLEGPTGRRDAGGDEARTGLACVVPLAGNGLATPAPAPSASALTDVDGGKGERVAGNEATRKYAQ